MGMKKSVRVALILGFLVIGCHGFLDRAEFGEECNALRKCNRRAFLWCNSTGVCDCSKPQSMLFDPNSADGGKCLLKIGEICKVPLGEDSRGQPTFQTLPCVGNSSCSAEGFCVCNSGFFENNSGTCDPMRKYLEDCDSQKLCNANRGLLCATNGSCVCNQDTKYVAGKGCLSLPGKACESNGVRLECLYSSTSCTDGFCQCGDPEKYSDSNGCFPKKGLNQTCKSDAECSRDGVTGTKLTCVAGVCNCDGNTSAFGLVLQYSFDDGTPRMMNPKLMCGPKHGQRCFEGYCSPGAVCEKAYDPYYQSKRWNAPFCKCLAGSNWSQKTNTCVAPHGGFCRSGSECQTGLFCKRSKCSCEFEELEFDSARGKCVGQVGGPCETEEDCKTSMECLKPDVGSPGECSCKPGYVETAAWGCAKTVGMTCSVDFECDPLAELECKNQKCACWNRAEYLQAERRCRRYAGTPCDKDGDCIDGADCFRSRKELRGFCRCRPGFIKRSNLTCISAEVETTTTDIANIETATIGVTESTSTEVGVANQDNATEIFGENSESLT